MHIALTRANPSTPSNSHSPDLLYQHPVSGKPKNPPLEPDQNAVAYLRDLVVPDSAADATSTNPGERDALENSTSLAARLNTASVRICNNRIASLAGLDRVLWHVMDDPRQTYWLDASCNALVSVGDLLLSFPNLRVLYLHGNQITSLADVLKLAKLQHLEKLTLHGNPIAELPNYKMMVCAHLPKLRSLDFSTITKLDRDKINVWYAGYLKRRASR